MYDRKLWQAAAKWYDRSLQSGESKTSVPSIGFDWLEEGAVLEQLPSIGDGTSYVTSAVISIVSSFIDSSLYTDQSTR